MQICLGRLVIALFTSAACLGVTRGVSAQTVSASGGLAVDARRYASGDAGPQVYDGQPLAGFAGVGVSLTKRFSVEFETSFSSDATTTITNPIAIAGAAPVDFTTTYHTRMQTYSGLFAVQLMPSARRVRVSVRGGVTYVHHRREIVPPMLLPADPRATTPTQTVEIVDNVAAPAMGIDADVPVTSRFAIVGAVRANWFTIEPELRAYSVRPMIGVRVRF